MAAWPKRQGNHSKRKPGVDQAGFSVVTAVRRFVALRAGRHLLNYFA
jgi:hypothetical protein